MRWHQNKARLFRAVTLGLLAGASAVPLLLTETAWAAERQFLVTLADSPKDGRVFCVEDADCRDLGGEFVCGIPNRANIGRDVCVVPCSTDADCAEVPQPDVACHPFLRICDDDLPSPELIRRQYFDKTDPNIDSFAEYWKEISYGDVTVAGRVTDWILLPWPISAPFIFVNLNSNPGYHYGSGEPFTNSATMVGVDIGGPITDPDYAQGGRQTTSGGGAVWTPGERFRDMNNNGVWDGYDESTNAWDWRKNGFPINRPADGVPDLKGPWIDLNGDGVPDNEPGCVYLDDSDNDGNLDSDNDLQPDDKPDCCPNGPKGPLNPTGVGCNGLFGTTPDTTDKACPATTWVTFGGGTIVDSNGNLIDDAIDLAASPGSDRLPLFAVDNSCTGETPDGIPDAAQFLASQLASGCVQTVPTNCDGPERDPCCGKPACLPPAGGARPLLPRCEFHDANGNDEMDVAEPFENFFPGKPSGDQIRFNYPGTNPDAVIARSSARPLGGKHDPKEKLTSTRDKVCADGLPYRTIGSQADVCPAGEHAQYDPPDAWIDLTPVLRLEPPGPLTAGSSKMLVGNGGITPQPAWYNQAWRDRYNGATPPPWDSSVSASLLDPYDPLMKPLAPGPNAFRPNRGGLNGNGTGWIGDLPDETPVLPDQLRGVEDLNPVIFYDGPVEHDDLPSSKYHMDGDQYLGEVTSPFSYSIAGDDRGDNDPSFFEPPDGIIPAAGPYAARLHGQNGRDGGNQLNIEVLTWRRGDGKCAGGINVGGFCDADGDCPGSTCEEYVNDGDAWGSRNGSHPYATQVSGDAKLGFRDYNLDGRLDLGEVRIQGAESYQGLFGGPTAGDSATTKADARSRILEDCIEILDETLDFDSYVDRVVLDAVGCYRPLDLADLPVPYTSYGPVTVAGILSGIVLIPPFHPGLPLLEPAFRPIHNEDGLDAVVNCTSGINEGNPCNADSDCPGSTCPDSDFPETNLPVSKLNWNIRFHNLVHTLGSGSETDISSIADFATSFAAHEYGHSWQNWPDLYDYDAQDRSGVENCPIGAWDIMATGGLVHPIAALKEAACTEWIKTVDLTSVLTPGVDKSITFPTAEFVRNDSYYYLENEDRPQEKMYFWSAGNGFDERMPGDGLLIVHADPDALSPSNRDAIALQQRSGLRPAYRIIQADGLHELEAGPGLDAACGDGGDPWPGATDQTTFDCSTQPASQWYTDEACTGLDILDVVPDQAGATRVTFNWTPTSIPSLKFVDPPGGVTVGSTYQIRSEANDVYGGTSIRFYYKKQDTGTPDFSGSTFISPQIKKTTSGPNDLSINWNIAGVPDGRYFIFADLIPGIGADGAESALTRPRAGRNNLGSASLGAVGVNTTTVSGTTVTHQGTSRSETWVIECVDASAGKWFVSSSLTQPLPPEEPSAALCAANPTRCATTGTLYTSVAGAVKFTIQAGGALGDTFTFTTTGITAPSAAATIRNGQIREDPTAVIDATPLSGPPPLEVDFDARNSTDPNGQPLTFRWDFGDGQTGSGAQVSHTYPNGGSYTVTLRATNAANGRFGETALDIEVTNNSPTAVIKATPTSGPAPLNVHFSASESSDTETPSEQLIYQWDYGDGLGANDDGVPGILREADHTYSRVNSNADATNCTATCPCTTTGRACTVGCPCEFTAVLKVTDAGGKSDTASLAIRVGNSNPVARVTTIPTVLQGVSPLTVTFNAKDSTDAENDTLEVEWTWGDGSANEKYPAKTGKPPATDGSVPHTFTLPAGATFKTYSVKAVVRDLKGGEASWGVTVTVLSQEPPGPTTNRPPTASFAFTPLQPFEDQAVTFDAGNSTDPDEGDELLYRWAFGDGIQTQFTSNPRATHAFASPGNYVVRLTVRDQENASTDSTRTVEILRIGANRNPVALIATGPRTGSAPLTLTFDGSLSFDPDGDAITTYIWRFRQSGALLETKFGPEPTVTQVFSTPGQYTVELVVRDSEDAEGSPSEPQSIQVTEPSQPPPPEPPPPRPEPEDPPDSAAQRPAPVGCGVGLLMGMFGCLLGVALPAVTRRRLKA